MTIAVGDRLPDAALIEMGPEGPRTVRTGELSAGRKLALFAVPGAFTSTCQNAHVPSFVRSATALRDKGVEEIACVAVNDPFVMQAFGAATGADGAGIRMLADPESDFTKAIGLDFSAPPAGLIDRSQRYSMLVEDGVIRSLNIEDSPGDASVSLGEELVKQM